MLYSTAQPQLVQRIQPFIAPSAPSTYNLATTPLINNAWAGQAFIQPGNTTPTLISASPYVMSTPSYGTLPGNDNNKTIYISTFKARGLFTAHVQDCASCERKLRRI